MCTPCYEQFSLEYFRDLKQNPLCAFLSARDIMNGFLNDAQLWHLIGVCEGEVPFKKKKEKKKPLFKK